MTIGTLLIHSPIGMIFLNRCSQNLPRCVISIFLLIVNFSNTENWTADRQQDKQINDGRWKRTRLPSHGACFTLLQEHWERGVIGNCSQFVNLQRRSYFTTSLSFVWLWVWRWRLSSTWTQPSTFNFKFKQPLLPDNSGRLRMRVTQSLSVLVTRWVTPRNYS